MEQCNQQNNESNIRLDDIKENFMNDFVQEILETLDAIELELVNLEVDPDNGEYLNQVYGNFHIIRGLTSFMEDSVAGRIAEQTEALLEACRKFNISSSRNIINALLQSILFLRKICKQEQIVKEKKFLGEVEQHLLSIRQLRDEILLEVKQPIRSPENRIGEILVEEGAIDKQDIEEVLEKQNSIYQKLKFGEIAVKEKIVDAGELIKAIRAQKIRNESNDQYVQIPLKRLDQIISIAQKLGSIQNGLHHESVLRFGSNDSFSQETKKAEGLSEDIRKILTELRRVSLQQTFRKLSRAVRAMIEEAGLHVVFSTIGESTELIKDIAEELTVPLAEIVGCMLKGFSPDSDRGKMGNIEVVAYQKEDQVCIEISSNHQPCSDMKGKKYEAIKAKISNLRGKLEIETLEEEGYKVKIRLPMQE